MDNELNLQGMWKIDSDDATIYRSMEKNWCRWIRVAVTKKVTTVTRLDFTPDGSSGRGGIYFEMQKTTLTVPVTVVRLEEKQ